MIEEEELIEIGSHTKTHAHLPKLSDAELKTELVGSKEAIEDHLGRPARYLAYPFGEEGERVRRAAEAAGYSGAFAAPGSSLRADPFRLPRTGLWRSDTTHRQLRKTRFAARLLMERRAPAQ